MTEHRLTFGPGIRPVELRIGLSQGNQTVGGLLPSGTCCSLQGYQAQLFSVGGCQTLANGQPIHGGALVGVGARIP